MMTFDDELENTLLELSSRISASVSSDEFVLTVSGETSILLVGEDLEQRTNPDAEDAINDAREQIAEIADRTGNESPSGFYLQRRGSTEYRISYGSFETVTLTLS